MFASGQLLAEVGEPGIVIMIDQRDGTRMSLVVAGD
jgi:hypothetical protein